jgi:phenylacetate-CoA ligase
LLQEESNQNILSFIFENIYLHSLMAFIPEIEKKSLQEQADLQFLKLKDMLNYIQHNSIFYKRLFSHHNIDLSTINTLEDLQYLPTTDKQDIQNYNWDFLCVPRDQIREYTATSGTLGTPVFVALTQNDLQRLAYNEFLSFHCMEVSEKDIFQLMLTLDRQFMAGTAYYAGLGKIGATVIRTGPGLPAMQWDTIRQLETTGLVAVPSFLTKLTEYAKTKGIIPETTSVRKVLAIGESLRDDALMPNALAQKIKQDWNIELYGTYASTEMQTAFTECSMGIGGHHHPELIIVELLDDHGRPVAPGEKGEVTITTLGVEGMPLLRYRTGDICRAYNEPCTCGRTTMRLGPVLGRKQQMIKFKGTTLYPPVIFEVLNQIEEIKEYIVEVSTGENGQYEINLYLFSLLAPEACNNIIKPLFQHRWRVTPHISFLSAEEMIKLQFSNNSRKPVKFRDLRIH